MPRIGEGADKACKQFRKLKTLHRHDAHPLATPPVSLEQLLLLLCMLLLELHAGRFCLGSSHRQHGLQLVNLLLHTLHKQGRVCR